MSIHWYNCLLGKNCARQTLRTDGNEWPRAERDAVSIQLPSDRLCQPQWHQALPSHRCCNDCIWRSEHSEVHSFRFHSFVPYSSLQKSWNPLFQRQSHTVGPATQPSSFVPPGNDEAASEASYPGCIQHLAAVSAGAGWYTLFACYASHLQSKQPLRGEFLISA